MARLAARRPRRLRRHVLHERGAQLTGGAQRITPDRLDVEVAGDAHAIAANRLYPVTIVQTRYGGIYEGGAWAAFLSHPEEIPPDAFGGDSVCVSWWSDFVYAVGVGATPDSALADLKAKHAAGHRLPAHASD